MMRDATLAAAERVVARCREIATYTERDGETYRPFLCPAAREVQELVTKWMERAGMAVCTDAAGNLRALRAGEKETSGRLLIGSHLDTVPNAGAFDGILGVLVGLAVVEEFGDTRLPFSLEVVAFSEEEGVRFGKPFFGSMAVAGRPEEFSLALTDREGVSVEAALRAFGLDPLELRAARADERAFAFFEVHIEQGPVLDCAGLSLGVVEAVMGQTRLLLRFRGQANHAGTTPMALRRDAVAAAAEWIGAVESRGHGTAGLVATVGRLEVKPGASNVIAAEVVATLDVRHREDPVRREVVEDLVERARRAGGDRGVEVLVEVTFEQAAVPMSGPLVETLERAVERSGHVARRITSGAGHDAMVMAERMPAAMLFVRSPGGISHHPEEAVLVEDVAAAIETVMEFCALLPDARVAQEVSLA